MTKRVLTTRERHIMNIKKYIIHKGNKGGWNDLKGLTASGKRDDFVGKSEYRSITHPPISVSYFILRPKGEEIDSLLLLGQLQYHACDFAPVPQVH